VRSSRGRRRPRRQKNQVSDRGVDLRQRRRVAGIATAGEHAARHFLEFFARDGSETITALKEFRARFHDLYGGGENFLRLKELPDAPDDDSIH
jgi:hypothetical protein